MAKLTKMPDQEGWWHPKYLQVQFSYDTTLATIGFLEVIRRFAIECFWWDIQEVFEYANTFFDFPLKNTDRDYFSATALELN